MRRSKLIGLIIGRRRPGPAADKDEFVSKEAGFLVGCSGETDISQHPGRAVVIKPARLVQFGRAASRLGAGHGGGGPGQGGLSNVPLKIPADDGFLDDRDEAPRGSRAGEREHLR